MTPEPPKTQQTPTPNRRPKNQQKSPKSLEESTLKRLFRGFMARKKDTSKLKFSQGYEKELNLRYSKAIQEHVKQFQSYFDTYFSTHSKKLIAFDIEEIDEQMVCACCITMWSPKDFHVDIILIERIHYLHSYSPRLFRRFQKWLQNSDADMVIIHGFNKNEANLINDCGGLEPVNTQMLLSKARQANLEGVKIKNDGIKHFEEFIGFTRKACKFFKHNIYWKAKFQMMSISLENHMLVKPQRECNICHQPQDVLLYCLEDAFTPLLIYVWYENNKGDIESTPTE